MLSMICFEFEAHFRISIPAFAYRVVSSRIKAMPSLADFTLSQLSSTIVDSMTVSAALGN